MRLRLTLALILIILVSVLGVPVPVFSASHGGAHADWQRYDTATYVVSTLNLLTTPAGRPLFEVWEHRLGVHRYDVYTDKERSALYYIELKRDDGTIAGAFAYKLGWLRPRVLVGDALGITPHTVPLKLLDAYRTDPKVLLASFSSTVP